MKSKSVHIHGWRLQKVEAPRISRQSAHECGKVVSLRHEPPLPARIYPWYSFLLEVQSTHGHSAAGRIKSI